MSAAASGAGRKAVVAEMCRMFGFSSSKAYNVLRENGWESGRARRKDAGSSSMSGEALLAIAALQKQGVRKNGKATLPSTVSCSVAAQNGIELPVGVSRVRALLKSRGLSVSDGKKTAPYQPMRTEYPNQVHFADPSVCLIYYAPGGKQKIISDAELYKNKNFLEGKPKCWRYVLTDHYSSSICVRYYAAAGESAANMYDFLLYAWGLKDNNVFVFHGLPELLIWDCGTANIAKATTNALKAFGVKTIPHLPGNPMAKGQVEGANNIVECHFESRLRFEPVESVEELNDAAARWCAAYNANMIPGLDTRLKRGGSTIGSRAMLWQRIPKDKLRELPDEQTCRQVFANGVQTRKVAGDLSVSIVHPKAGHSLRYSVRDLQGILVGMEVQLQPVLVSEDPLVIVSYQHEGKELSFEIAPIQYDEAGFDVSAPVFGESYKRPKDTEREKQAKVLDNPGIASVMGAAHSFINPQTPFMKQSVGEKIDIAQTVHTHEIIISAVEAAKRYKAATGNLPEGFIDNMRAEYPEGVPSRVVDELIIEARGAKETKSDYSQFVTHGGAEKNVADVNGTPAQVYKIA
jgi:hypothetical protein